MLHSYTLARVKTRIF